MSSSYGRYPNGSWKSPVANAAALPLVGNSIGDIRITLDTFTLFVWNGTAWINPLVS